MNRIYCAIGKITEVTQLIEVALGEICEASEIVKEFGRHAKMTVQDYEQAKSDALYLKEKMQTMTFGALISVIYESKSLSYDEINELKALLEKRNYFTHEYFKYTKFEGEGEAFILEEFEALKEYLAKLKKMENKLEIIKSSKINQLNYLAAKAGL
ncbi:MAG: hypothetical protein J6J33_03430 [Clostridia bacterium]|nr:hypothetical protein [Clostridia bacterium]